MNRGALQSSVMQQQMMGSENPSWWNMVNSGSIRTSSTQQSSPNNNSPNFLFPHSSLPFPSNFLYDFAQDKDQLPESWSHLLLGGLVGEDDQKGCMGGVFQGKKLEDWEEEILNTNTTTHHQQQHVDVKKENSAHATSCAYVYGHGGSGGGVDGDNYPSLPPKQTWSSIIPVSSPQSCVTSFSSNMLDFSNNNTNSPPDSRPRHPPPDRSSECNSNAAGGGAVKKARVQSSSNQTTFKVRKEKLGDRITALHQLVSPFGKTDTASVLLEAIGYIRFLHSQIEALSLPYLGNTSATTRQLQQHSVQGDINSVFPEHTDQDEEGKKDLRSRGLCLVPVSCTLQVGSDNGADYWAPAFGGGGGFR